MSDAERHIRQRVAEWLRSHEMYAVREGQAVVDGRVRDLEHPFEEWDALRGHSSEFVRLCPLADEVQTQHPKVSEAGEILYPGQLKQLEDAGFRVVTEEVAEAGRAWTDDKRIYTLLFGQVPPWMEQATGYVDEIADELLYRLRPQVL